MNIETALEIARYISTENCNTSEIIERAFQICELNKIPSHQTIISKVDFSFVELLKSLSLSQREKDILFIFAFFNKCAYTISQKLSGMKVNISKEEKHTYIKVYKILCSNGSLERYLSSDQNILINVNTFKDFLES